MEEFIARIENFLQSHETELENPSVINKFIRLVDEVHFPNVELEVEGDIFQHMVDFMASEFKYLSAGRFKQIVGNCYRSFREEFPHIKNLDLKFATHFVEAFHFILDDRLRVNSSKLVPQIINQWLVDESLKKYGRKYVFETLRDTLLAIFYDRQSKKDETWYMIVCGICNPKNVDPFDNRCSKNCLKNAYSVTKFKEKLIKKANTIAHQILTKYPAFGTETTFRAIGILFRDSNQWKEPMYTDIQSIFGDILDYITYLTNKGVSTVYDCMISFYKRDIRRAKKYDILLTKNIPRFEEKYKSNLLFYERKARPQDVQDLVIDIINEIYEDLDPYKGKGQWKILINQFSKQYKSEEYVYYLVICFLLRNIAFAHKHQYSVDKKGVDFIQKAVDIMLRSLATITEFALIYIRNFNLS